MAIRLHKFTNKSLVHTYVRTEAAILNTENKPLETNMEWKSQEKLPSVSAAGNDEIRQ